MESGRQRAAWNPALGCLGCKVEGAGYKQSVKLYTDAERLRELQCKASHTPVLFGGTKVSEV